MGSFSIWHWVIVLVVVLLVFGTKKIPSIGKDLGAAFRGFKEGIKAGEDKPAEAAAEKTAAPHVANGQTIEGEVKDKVKS